MSGSDFRRRRIVYSIFLLLGVGILVPWNAFISASGYFHARLCQTSIGSEFESVFATIFNLSSVVTMGLVLLIQWARDQLVSSEEEDGHRLASDVGTPTVAEPPAQTSHGFVMVTAPFTVNLAVFLGQAIMVLFLNVSGFELWTLLSLALCGMCVSIATAGVVTTASHFPTEQAMHPFLAGQSLGGVMVSVANFLTASWEDPVTFWNDHCSNATVSSWTKELTEPFPSSVAVRERRVLNDSCAPYERVDFAVFFYFLLGSLTLALCLGGYHYIHRLHQSRDNYETVEVDVVSSRTSEAIEESPRIGLEMNHPALTLAEESRGDVPTPTAKLVRDEGNNDGIFRDANTDSTRNETLVVWSHIKGPATCIFLTFFVTLALFPGWTSQLRSIRQCQTKFRLSNDLYTPFSFVLFNIGDLAGRFLAGAVPVHRINRLSSKLVVASLLRFLFFPLLFLCVGGNNANLVQIRSDLFSVLVQFAFAVSNGLLVSMSFAYAPSLLLNDAMQERSSEILTFSVALGLLTGSFVSFPVSRLGGGH